MKLYHRPALIVLFAAVISTPAATADEKAEADVKKRLRGTWTVTSLAILDGKKMDVGVATWTFEGDMVVVREGEKETARWEYSLRILKDLPLIDFTTTRDGETRRLLMGVLDPEADKLTLLMRPDSVTESDTPPFLRQTVVEAIGRKGAIVMTFKQKK